MWTLMLVGYPRDPSSPSSTPQCHYSVVDNREEQELWHGSLPLAVLRVETHSVNEGSESQRPSECMPREDVSMFSMVKMKRGNIN